MFEPKKSAEIKNDISIQHIIDTEKRFEYSIEDLLNPKENHSVFEYNLKENTLRYAEIIYPTMVNYCTWKEDLKKREIVFKDNCIYITALNIENAIKHFNRKFNLTLDKNSINVEIDKSHGGKHLKVEVKKYKH